MDDRKTITRKNIGITSNVITDRLGLDGYRLIKKAGFDTIDFNMQRGFFSIENNAFEHSFINRIYEHKREIENCGLVISQTHAPYYTLEKYMNNYMELDKYFYVVEQSLLATICLGCKRFIIHPLHKYKWMRESEFELTQRMISRLYNIAHKEKIHICIENLPYDFCGDYSSHKEFLEILEDYEVKACFDAGHSKICNEKPLLHLKKMRELIYAVHIHDNDGIRDLHYRLDEKEYYWQLMINEMVTNKNIVSISLETSGIYKKCDTEKIYSELVLDFESVNSYMCKTKKVE